MSGPIDPRANGLLPVVPISQMIALEKIPARETQELRMHRRHLLHQIHTKTVGAVVIGRRKQGHQL
jgi:hypothetical protein